MNQKIEKGDIIYADNYKLIVLNVYSFHYDYKYLYFNLRDVNLETVRTWDSIELEPDEILIKSTKLLRILYGIN